MTPNGYTLIPETDVTVAIYNCVLCYWYVLVTNTSKTDDDD